MVMLLLLAVAWIDAAELERDKSGKRSVFVGDLPLRTRWHTAASGD